MHVKTGPDSRTISRFNPLAEPASAFSMSELALFQRAAHTKVFFFPRPFPAGCLSVMFFFSFFFSALFWQAIYP
jgi:hypothetical protein